MIKEGLEIICQKTKTTPDQWSYLGYDSHDDILTTPLIFKHQTGKIAAIGTVGGPPKIDDSEGIEIFENEAAAKTAFAKSAASSSI